MDRERRVAGWLVLVVEAVDVLLETDAVALRQVPVVDEPAGHRVRSGVDVQREGRQRVAPGLDVRVDAWILEFDARVRLLRRWRLPARRLRLDRWTLRRLPVARMLRRRLLT
jgi:hypothetical protein